MKAYKKAYGGMFTADAYDGLTAAERRHEYKRRQAEKASGWAAYPDTCRKIFKDIPPEWWDKYSAREIGEFAALLKKAYDKGVAYGRVYER